MPSLSTRPRPGTPGKVRAATGARRSLVPATLLVAAVLQGACGFATGSAPSRTPPSTPPAPGQAPTATAPANPPPPSIPPAPERTYPPAPVISVPSGFAASLYATGLNQPAAMAFGPDGRLYVAGAGGSVSAIDATGRVDVVASGLPIALGLVWVDRRLYVAEQGRIDRFDLNGTALTGRAAVVSGLPYGRHQQDNILAGPDGRLYFGSGSTCDVCTERDPRSAAVLSMLPDGSDLKVFARGTRNPFGLTFQPGTGRLYVAVNGQDNLGSAADPEPADAVVIASAGLDFGFPRCWPDFRTRSLSGDCAGVASPAAYLTPHSSADGIAFYTGSTFPREYAGNLFVAEWGSFYGSPVGRRVVRVPIGADGNASAEEILFASGFTHPLGVLVAPDGALLVCDQGNGSIYRIQTAIQ